MLYLKCPNCKNILGNKQLEFEYRLKQICDNSKLSESDKNKKKESLLDDLGLDKYCCRTQIMSYCKLIEYIK